MTAAFRRSIACASALTVALGASGCGGHRSDRDRVNDYVRQANEIQGRGTTQFKQANDAYLRFSQGKLPAGKAPRELARAERAMRITRSQLADLKPPPKAAELHRRLLALYDADTELAHESTLLARYIPAAAHVAAPLAVAGRRLARDLKGATPAAESKALDRYAASVGGVEARFRKLQPPPILNAQFGAQLRRLTAARSLAKQIARAVTRRDSAKVAKLLLRFRRLGAVQPAGRLGHGAVAAYNRRYEGVKTALAAVARERAHLDRTLK